MASMEITIHGNAEGRRASRSAPWPARRGHRPRQDGPRDRPSDTPHPRRGLPPLPRHRGPARRGGQVPRLPRGPLRPFPGPRARARRPGPRGRRRGDIGPGGLRGLDLAAGRGLRLRAHHPPRDGRRLGRRQERPGLPRSQEPGGHFLPAPLRADGRQPPRQSERRRVRVGHGRSDQARGHSRWPILRSRGDRAILGGNVGIPRKPSSASSRARWR